MSITYLDEARHCEVNLGPSDAMPGFINVTIFGPDEFSVQQIIFELADEFGYVNFTHPARCADHRWGAMGRVQ